jgi:succinate-semialdehyde dehydrogenase / glutarate-semialdehyde dehydrogenase
MRSGFLKEMKMSTQYQYPKLQMLINGKWRDTKDHEPVLNPAEETVIGQLPMATRQDLDDALEAAQAGFRAWRATSPAKRAEILLNGARLVRERVDEHAYAITLEQGKPLAQSKSEILRGCEIIEWDATEGRRVYGRIIPSEPGMRHTVLRQPVGIVAAFSPWNFPMSSPARKIAGALSAGCSIIIKASEETPAGAMLLAKALTDGGLPPGALNLIFGNPAEISDYLIPKPQVRLITFTGSIPVGKRLTTLAGQHMKPVIMELGGHAPVLVCEDADPVAAGTTCAIGKSRNSGQVCTAPTRFFVHDKIYREFSDAIARKANAIKEGNGLDPASDMGPLANRRRLEAMEMFVEDAAAKGAKILAGGRRIGDRGYHFQLTVLGDIPIEARAMSEEPFGPLALVHRVRSLDEAIEKANSLPFGLAGYAFTRSAATAHRLSEEVEVGNLGINHFVASVAETPFGGVKESGFGREGGTEGLECYTVTKNVSHLIE